MDIFCRDEKLNLSPYYLKPGFAFGGSCLPKDVRALQYRAKEVDVELPVIQADPRQQPAADPARARPGDRDRQEAGRPARLQLQGRHRRSAREPDRHPRRGAARQGLSTLRIYDRNVSLARLVGANKEYIEQQIPHLSSLLCDSIDEVHRAVGRHRRRQRLAGVRRGPDAHAPTRSSSTWYGSQPSGRRFPGSIRESAGKAARCARRRHPAPAQFRCRCHRETALEDSRLGRVRHSTHHQEHAHRHVRRREDPQPREPQARERGT